MGQGISGQSDNCHMCTQADPSTDTVQIDPAMIKGRWGKGSICCRDDGGCGICTAACGTGKENLPPLSKVGLTGVSPMEVKDLHVSPAELKELKDLEHNVSLEKEDELEQENEAEAEQRRRERILHDQSEAERRRHEDQIAVEKYEAERRRREEQLLHEKYAAEQRRRQEEEAQPSFQEEQRRFEEEQLQFILQQEFEGEHGATVAAALVQEEALHEASLPSTVAPSLMRTSTFEPTLLEILDRRDRMAVDSFLWENGFKGGDVNTKRRKLLKTTFPLHVAVTKGDARMVEVLLRMGADISKRSSSGETALDLARKLQNKDPPWRTPNGCYAKLQAAALSQVR